MFFDHRFACCAGALHRIGDNVSERLDIERAQLMELVTRRRNYVCRGFEEGVIQAPAPARLIEGGPSAEATVTLVIISK